MMSENRKTISQESMERLDKEYADYCQTKLATLVSPLSVDISEVRRDPERFTQPWCRDYSGESFVTDVKIRSDDGHEFTARCYSPDPDKSAFGAGPYPVHINFHGGGWVLGDLSGESQLCMRFRNQVGIMVVDVDYRLCPENTFLRGHQDAWCAVQWIHKHASEINVRPDSISIGGASAGGHISAVIQQLARDAHIDLKLAVLGVPSTAFDFYLEKPSDSSYPSVEENAWMPGLDWDAINYFMRHVRPKNDEERAEIESRPPFYKRPIDGDLRGVCETFIATAECDPLRDEGEAYGQKLIRAGVRVAIRRYIGVGHLFMGMLETAKSRLFMEDVCSELKRVHGA